MIVGILPNSERGDSVDSQVLFAKEHFSGKDFVLSAFPEDHKYWDLRLSEDEIICLTSEELRSAYLNSETEFVWLVHRAPAHNWTAAFPHKQWQLEEGGQLYPLKSHLPANWFRAASGTKTEGSYFRPHDIGEARPAFGATTPLGFRDSNRNPTKAPGARSVSVAVVGGSILFGSYLFDDETVSAQVEKRLNSTDWAKSNSVEYSVRNLGYPNSGILENLIRLFLFEDLTAFDCVILMHGFDDIHFYRDSGTYELEENSILHRDEYFEWGNAFLQWNLDYVPAKASRARPHPTEVARAYSVRLRQFLSTLRRHGIDAVSVREPWSGNLGAECFKSGQAVDANLKSVGRTLDVARKGHVDKSGPELSVDLIDYFETGQWRFEDCFYDPQNLTPHGAGLVSEVCTQMIRDIHTSDGALDKIADRRRSASVNRRRAGFTAPPEGAFADLSRDRIAKLIEELRAKK